HMKLRSRRRSTNSPTMSKSMLIAICCSSWRANRSFALKPQADYKQGQHGDLQAARGPVQPERGPDVGCAKLAVAVADPALVDRHAVIDTGTRQADAERARHGGPEPAGLGRGMMVRIAAHDRQRPGRRQTEQWRRQHQP